MHVSCNNAMSAASGPGIRVPANFHVGCPIGRNNAERRFLRFADRDSYRLVGLPIELLGGAFVCLADVIRKVELIPEKTPMDRRLLLLAAAAATTTAVPVLAQTNTAPQLGEAAKKHDRDTAMVGHASLLMADIALQKASEPKVKQFAQFEHDEQVTVTQVLKSIDPTMNPPPPDAATQAIIDKLRQMREGPAFDREFVTAQTQGHEKLRTIQEEYLQAGKDPDVINPTRLIFGMVKEHLTLLGDLRRAA